ncbi:MAG TPA: hypothetical protein PK280_03370 [Planctomycetota bacterium]|nr:hypothetical protein [Planctomycetota bacterium]
MTPHLEVKRRYRVPDVRLRIVNTEMAVIGRRAAGQWLATAAYSNRGGQLVLIRPDGREHRVIATGHAGMMLQADERGRLVFGIRDLARFDPTTGRIAILARKANSGIWGGCVTRRLIVAGASTPDGMLSVYDRASRRVVKQWAPLHPRAFYHYRALEAPDGRVLVMSSLPNAVLTLLDQANLEVEPFEPPAIKGMSGCQGGQFLAPSLFYLHSGARAFLLRYPGFETIAEIPAPRGVNAWSRKTVILGGRVVAWGHGTNRFFVLDAARRRWRPLVDEPVLPLNPELPENCDTFAALGDGAIAGITSTGLFFRIAKGARRAETRQIEIAGPVHGAPLLVVRDGRVQKAYGSAHVNQRLWDVDLGTGRGRDLGDSGPGGGQINDLFWDAKRRRVYMGSYTTCTLIEYDPARGGRFPENPRELARVGHGQMRPLQLIHDGDFAWMTSSPYYGTLGGALSRIGLGTGRVRVFRDLVAGQTPTAMLLSRDRRTMYLSMTVEGDCGSAIVEARSAHLVVFDARKLRVVRSFAPFRQVPRMLLRALLADGRLLFQDGGNFEAGAVLWTWDPRDDAVRRVGLAPAGLRQVLTGPGGRGLWATGCEGVGPLVLGDPCRIEPAADPTISRRAFDRVCKHLQWVGPELWLITGPEILCLTAKRGGRQ